MGLLITPPHSSTPNNSPHTPKILLTSQILVLYVSYVYDLLYYPYEKDSSAFVRVHNYYFNNLRLFVLLRDV